MSELEEKTTKPAKPKVPDPVTELFRETSELKAKFEQLAAAMDQTKAEMEDLKKRLPPARLSSVEVGQLITANPYCSFQILEPVRLGGMVYHKGHVFRADTMKDVVSLVQTHGLQLAAVEPPE